MEPTCFNYWILLLIDLQKSKVKEKEGNKQMTITVELCYIDHTIDSCGRLQEIQDTSSITNVIIDGDGQLYILGNRTIIYAEDEIL